MSLIKVDYNSLANASQTITSTARNIEGKLSDLKSMLQQMQWEGSDQASYHQAQMKWDQAMADIRQLLAEIGGAVQTAQENYMQTEQANASMWNG
jgi:WXG100 family type VII secretion target